MKNGHKIAILMATYNGGAYIREQLDSLFAQSMQDWELFVHDDCSTDDTVPIIKEFVNRYPDRVFLMEDYIDKGRGARDSFIWLVENVDSEYYMLSDQDDVWLEKKVENAYDNIKAQESISPQSPIAVYTDLILVDKDGRSLGQTFWERAKVMDDWYDSLDSLLVLNGRAAGCTMIFNRFVRDIILPIDPRIYMHDIWIVLKTALCGRVIGMHESYIHYRLHGDNSCGVPVKDNRFWWTKRMKRITSFFADFWKMYTFVHEVTGCSLFRFTKAKLHVIIDRMK